MEIIAGSLYKEVTVWRSTVHFLPCVRIDHYDSEIPIQGMQFLTIQYIMHLNRGYENSKKVVCGYMKGSYICERNTCQNVEKRFVSVIGTPTLHDTSATALAIGAASCSFAYPTIDAIASTSPFIIQQQPSFTPGTLCYYHIPPLLMRVTVE